MATNELANKCNKGQHFNKRKEFDIAQNIFHNANIYWVICVKMLSQTRIPSKLDNIICYDETDSR